MSKTKKGNQIVLEVSSNADDYLKNPVRKINVFKITGTWGLSHAENKVALWHNHESIGALSGEDFLKLAKKIQKCDDDHVKKVLNESSVNADSIKETVQELDLVKALFNLFSWMEPYFVMPYDFESNKIIPRLYDEFVLDSPGKPGTQKDIYLLPMNFDKNAYRSEIETLMHLNLFSSVKIKVDGIEKENYFIPFTKPPYTKEIFPNTAAHMLWNNILELRHQCFKEFQKRRVRTS